MEHAARARAARALDQALAQIKLAADALREPIDVPEIQSLGAIDIPAIIRAARGEYPTSAVRSEIREPRRALDRAREQASVDASLGKGERLVLTAIAQHEDGVTREQITVLTGYKRSTRDAYVQRLGASGLCEVEGDTITATDAGVAALGHDFEPLPRRAALRDIQAVAARSECAYKRQRDRFVGNLRAHACLPCFVTIGVRAPEDASTT